MDVIDNIRIKRLDNANITWERYQEQEVGKVQKDVIREKRMAWVQVGGYYTSVEDALQSIIKVLKREMVNNASNVENYLEALKTIEIKVSILDGEEK